MTQSFYSVKPAATYFRDDVEEDRKRYDMYEFIQEAGDLVYVPDYYGHGMYAQDALPAAPTVANTCSN